MNKTKPTPGPWHVNESTASVWSKDQLIATTLNEGFNHQYHPVVANANLIAAAPEMLEALKSIHEQLDHDMDGYYDNELKQMENLIAKAEGKN